MALPEEVSRVVSLSILSHFPTRMPSPRVEQTMMASRATAESPTCATSLRVSRNPKKMIPMRKMRLLQNLSPLRHCSGRYRPSVLAKRMPMRMPTMRGEKDRCLKKGRVLKAVAAPARRAMKSMPGREGKGAGRRISYSVAGEGRNVSGLSRSGQECGWGEEKASVVAVRDFPYNERLHQNKMF